ncbi:hypothetical protein LR48_Vigan05g036200 [Vigna angularis]|uniref:Uncharacterized protein n=1 Tax=Phaseolus angularis TaxID=3914 RepID=A0A0L9UJ10_PHAAN|nr:hypothetical protein LR48_Vigan05g036200 [Vigna angularis]
MMKFLRCGGKICMNNNDVENNYKGEEQPSRNVIESSEERRSDEAKAHGWWLLPKKTYDSIKENKPESDWSEIDEETILQQRPRGNTVLHIAALYGNDKCVEKVLQIGEHLLLTINGNGDTPLHVAARAGKISTLEKLVAALLHRNYEEAKEAILITNKQGNTFFHEALLNGHKNVMNILVSSPGFKQLAEETVFVSSNNNDKSVLGLAIEKGYEDIVDDVLTRMIPTNEVDFREDKVLGPGECMKEGDIGGRRTSEQGNKGEGRAAWTSRTRTNVRSKGRGRASQQGTRTNVKTRTSRTRTNVRDKGRGRTS